jgi:glycosyltransferase involved in cell wall biosynthesis
MKSPLTVSVILPTKALKERGASLDRAVRSVFSQERVSVQLIVVANGAQCDREILEEFGRRRHIRLIRIDRASFSQALKVGRSFVDTPFFAELDDDDELLPHALATRIEHMKSDLSTDVVVTNGFICSGGLCKLNILDFTEVKADPLRAVLDNMWLIPCGAMYRTDTVGADLFDGIPPSLEWTYLALLLALKKNISFIDTPTFIYNRDTENALSKSKDWIASHPMALRAMLQLDLPADVEARLRSKHVRAVHCNSVIVLEDGHWTRAWKWHLRSLVGRGGWRYLSYTRHLLISPIFAMLGRFGRDQGEP